MQGQNSATPVSQRFECQGLKCLPQFIGPTTERGELDGPVPDGCVQFPNWDTACTAQCSRFGIDSPQCRAKCRCEYEPDSAGVAACATLENNPQGPINSCAECPNTYDNGVTNGCLSVSGFTQNPNPNVPQYCCLGFNRFNGQFIQPWDEIVCSRACTSKTRGSLVGQLNIYNNLCTQRCLCCQVSGPAAPRAQPREGR